MAGTVGHGGGVSTEGNSIVQHCESDEAVTEWRSSEQLETAIPSTSPPYWDIDDEDDSGRCLCLLITAIVYFCIFLDF